MLSLMWFKSDLRILDNPALLSAMTKGPVIAVYMLSEPQWQKHGLSSAKKSLIIRQLKSLNDQLATLNVPLHIEKTASFDALPQDLLNLAVRYSASGIHYNREYELNERRCEQQVQKLLGEQGISCFSHQEACLVEPRLIRNKQGKPFKVFSAFKRSFHQHSAVLLRSLYRRPDPQKGLRLASDLSVLRELEARSDFHQAHDVDNQTETCADYADLWPAGEDEAHQRLERFGEQGISHYQTDRDIPSVEGTSTLSPYLAIGALSTRQCLQLAMQENHGSIDASSSGASTWINELLWREFYRHLLNDFPKLCCFKPFKPETDMLPWRHDSAMFDAWKNARTGYPIVDAAMRQLKHTGWMHNRLRMVTAMFLTKHLFIDWRWGEAYFMSQLVDGDLASNNGGWQWSASTGVDAVPYFRIFNPTRQSQRFDPQGIFIRRFLPELAELDNKSIHQPTASQALSSGYCLPVVDHRTATEQTKGYFQQLNTRYVAGSGE